MKPAPFEYVAATTVATALDALRDEDARVLAGGQSLVPLMNMRLARPTVIVDVNGIRDLDSVSVGEAVRIGALTRHRSLELEPEVLEAAPLLAKAAALIGHAAIRNRGTLGGSVAHGDPAAELPAALLALEGSVVLAGPGGTRMIDGASFYTGMFSTAMEPGELLVEVRVPRCGAGETAAFVEVADRHGDFAVAGVAAQLVRDLDGACTRVRLAGCGLGATPVDLSASAEVLLGESVLSETMLRELARRIAASVEPGSDIHASGEDRRELAQLLAVSAIRDAWQSRPQEVAA